MKRLSAISALCLCITFLCSCGSPPTLNAEFDSSFEVTQDDMLCKGTIKMSDDALKIAVLEPYTAEGMSFDYVNDSLEISYGEHTTKVNCNYIPAGAIPSVLHNVLTYIDKAQYLRSEDGEDVYSVTTPYGEAIIKAADGSMLSLEDPYSGLYFRFYD